MIVLQINSNANTCSHGRIAEEIGRLLIKRHHECYIAFGRTEYECKSTLIRIGGKSDLAWHLLKSRLLDRHGFGSIYSTRNLIKKIKLINPDIIHLHNIHGYYINIKILFEFLKIYAKPVIWTFHDCWPFTGHCAHFQHLNCNKWQTQCFDCPNPHGYPKSWFIDNSRKNFLDKKKLVQDLNNMILVSPSIWLENNLKYSFFAKYKTVLINNGVDLDKFKPVETESIRSQFSIHGKYVLGVANVWTRSKGLDDFGKLREILDKEILIVLAGLKRRQIKKLPEGIKGISRTENVDQLAALYSGAECFINPTYADNFPTTNLEALACGTPVITYDTGGSSETISPESGFCIPKGEIGILMKDVMEIIDAGKDHYQNICRKRAVDLFDKNHRYDDYIRLYESLSSCG